MACLSMFAPSPFLANEMRLPATRTLTGCYSDVNRKKKAPLSQSEAFSKEVNGPTYERYRCHPNYSDRRFWCCCH
jgi:hypothetical protein